MCSVIDGSKAVIMTQSNFCNYKARCLIAVYAANGLACALYLDTTTAKNTAGSIVFAIYFGANCG